MSYLNFVNSVASKIVFVTLLILAFSLGAIALYTAEMKQQTRVVAEVISAEACSEGPHAMLGVASTIRNRSEQRNLTAYQVVTEPNQYYGLTNPNREKIFSDVKCSEPAMQMAQHINDIPDIVSGAIFFKTVEEKRQPWHKIKTAQIGKVEFYK